MAGKGSNQRPKAVDEQTFESNWDRTFSSRPIPSQGVIDSAFAEIFRTPFKFYRPADENKPNDQQDK